MQNNPSSFSPVNPEPIQSPQQLSDLIPALRALPAVVPPAVPEQPKGQNRKKKRLSNQSTGNSNNSTFTDSFVDPGVVARPAGIKTHVRRRDVEDVFAESSSLYRSHQHILCHSFDYDCFVNLPCSIHVRVQVLYASTTTEVLKKGEPILKGQLETTIHLQKPVDCNSVDNPIKFKLLDSLRKHSKRDFMLCVSYRLTKDDKPFLVRQSPHFTCFAHGPSKRERAVDNAENENEIEAKKKRLSGAIIVSTGNKVTATNGTQELEEEKKRALGCYQPTQLQGDQGLPSFRQNDVRVDYQPNCQESRGSNNILSGSNFTQQRVTTNLEDDQEWDNLQSDFRRQENADCYEQNPQESPVIYLSPLNTNDWLSNILDSP